MAYILGIDPGKKGALAVLSQDQKEVYLYPFAKLTDVEKANLFFDWGIQECRAWMEKVGAMPGQGVTSMFTFGQENGFIKALLTANRIGFELVPPQTWQQKIGLPKKSESKPERKSRLKALAQQLYPTQVVTLDTCDALLIAEYGRRLVTRGS